MEAGLDWIQFSAAGKSMLADEMESFARDLRKTQERDGYLAKSLSIHGYFGWSVGHVAYLINEKRDRVMLKVSSDLAAAHEAYLASLAVDENAAVTRVDLQATLWYNTYMPEVAEDLGRRVAAVRNGRTTPRATYINGFGNGDTMYIGAPSSDKRVRVYDKYKESGGDDNYRYAWRYEVQYRSTYAHQVLKSIAAEISTQEGIGSIINSEFEPYGFVVVPDVRVVQKPQTTPRGTDIERRLYWLRNQVAPAARQVAYEVGWDTILEILKGE